MLNMDHIKPRARFPHLALDIRNLQPACADCNTGKGNGAQTDWQSSQIPRSGFYAAVDSPPPYRKGSPVRRVPALPQHIPNDLCSFKIVGHDEV